MPWPLQEAINHGLAILSWFENFTGDEIPPENLWDDGVAVEEHFKMVRARQKEQSQGTTDGGLDDEEMMGNDLARSFKD